MLADRSPSADHPSPAPSPVGRPLRVCLIYDCLFPWTIGGAERWYRILGERFAEEGHEVTYLTLRQWPRDEPPEIPGVRVVAVGPRMGLYVEEGRRRVLPPLVFGLGVFYHLLRHPRSYDIVHTASFPYFSLLAAALLRRVGRFRLLVDWHEVWGRDYWRSYLGRVGGSVGYAVERLCARVRHEAFTRSHHQARRVRELGYDGEPIVLEAYAGPLEPSAPVPAEDVAVFAGRLIPEKEPLAVGPAVAIARRRIPGLRGEVYGDGPLRTEVDAMAAASDGAVAAKGFVPAEELDAAVARALCMLAPSRREGYGLVVVEAAAKSVPSVVVDHPDNAMVDHVADGVNGVVAPSASPEDLAAAIERVHAGGEGMRRTTREWFAANAQRLSLETSLRTLLDVYADSARS